MVQTSIRRFLTSTSGLPECRRAFDRRWELRRRSRHKSCSAWRPQHGGPRTPIPPFVTLQYSQVQQVENPVCADSREGRASRPPRRQRGDVEPGRGDEQVACPRRSLVLLSTHHAYAAATVALSATPSILHVRRSRWARPDWWLFLARSSRAAVLAESVWTLLFKHPSRRPTGRRERAFADGADAWLPRPSDGAARPQHERGYGDWQPITNPAKRCAMLVSGRRA